MDGIFPGVPRKHGLDGFQTRHIIEGSWGDGSSSIHTTSIYKPGKVKGSFDPVLLSGFSINLKHLWLEVGLTTSRVKEKQLVPRARPVKFVVPVIQSVVTPTIPTVGDSDIRHPFSVGGYILYFAEN